MRMRRKPTAASGLEQTELADRIMPNLNADGRFDVPAEHLVQPPMGRPAAGHPAPIRLLELVAGDRVGEEVGEVRKQIERVALDERGDPRRRVRARALAVDGERVP